MLCFLELFAEPLDLQIFNLEVVLDRGVLLNQTLVFRLTFLKGSFALLIVSEGGGLVLRRLSFFGAAEHGSFEGLSISLNLF